jgi:hypothetical protein
MPKAKVTSAPAPVAKPKLFGAPDSMYITSQQKQDMIARGTRFSIDSAEYETDKGYQGAPRWLLTINLEGETSQRWLTFDSNPKRDATMGELTAYLHEAAEPYGPCVLAKSGNAVYINDVSDESDEAPEELPY